MIFLADADRKNSFASVSVQGISFLNAYQKEYNEVFFMDDFAHQSGHVIFSAMIYDVDNFIQSDELAMVADVLPTAKTG